MKRSFLSDQEITYLKNQESNEEKQTKKDYSDKFLYRHFTDYTPKYKDYYLEELKNEEENRKNNLKKIINDERNALSDDKWSLRKKELIDMIKYGSLPEYVLSIIEEIDLKNNNF